MLLLSCPASLVAAVAVLTSGFIAAFLPVRSVIGTIVWYPFLLYSVERALRQPGWTSANLMLCVGTYCLATAGHPEPGLLILAAVCGYIAIRSVVARCLPLGDVLRVAASVLAGGLIAAPLWLNFADYLLYDGAAVPHPSNLGIVHFPWWSAPSLVLPHLYGPLNRDGTFARAGWFSAMVVALAVAGIAALLLRRETRHPGRVAIGLITAVITAKLFGVPGINDVGRLPLLREFLFDYGSGLMMIGIGILSGIGFDYVRRAPIQKLGWGVGLCLALAAVLGAIQVAVLHNEAVLADPGRVRHFVTALCFGLFWFVAAPIGLMIARSVPARRNSALIFVTISAMLLHGWASQPSGTGMHYMVANVVSAAAFICCLLVAAHLVRLSRKTAWVAPMVLVGVLSATTCQYAAQMPSRYNPLAAAPYVARLQALQGAPRVYALDGILFPNFGAALGIHSVTNLENLVPIQSAAFISTYLDPGVHPARFYGVNHVRYPGSGSAIEAFANRKRYWDFIGVRYVLSATADVTGSKIPLEPTQYDPQDGIRWWTNPSGFPRAFLATNVETVPNWQVALTRLADIRDLSSTAYLESPIGEQCIIRSGGVPSGASAGRLVSLDVTPNTVAVTYEANAPGVLILTDAYMRGWRATLDNREVPVLRVNGAFRGVCISTPGEHRIHFSYKPALWLWSLGLALGGILIAGALEMSRRRHAVRPQPMRTGLARLASIGRPGERQILRSHDASGVELQQSIASKSSDNVREK